MLKLFVFSFNSYATDQPPSGGCVLKRDIGWDDTKIVDQPPSGGCVLKHPLENFHTVPQLPAAFRRLCVETYMGHAGCSRPCPAAFRRLCVETQPGTCPRFGTVPAAFRRLCVETTRIHNHVRLYRQPPSGGCVLKHFGGQNNTMLIEPAAFRRLCVETHVHSFLHRQSRTSRLQAAVC